MIFEKDVSKAIDILKDICYILPPYQIPGLSYVQELDEFEETAIKESYDGGFDPTDDIMPGPRKGSNKKDQHSKLFSKKLFDKSKTQPRSQEFMKGRLIFGQGDEIQVLDQ